MRFDRKRWGGSVDYMSRTPEQKKRKMYNHMAYLRKKGLRLTKEEFLKLAKRYFEGAVLTSRDNSWTLESLCWKDKDWFSKQRFVDGLRLFQTTGRWYSKKFPGSWRSREEAQAALLKTPTYDSFNQDKGYLDF